jgi:hypothetical protein
MVIFKKCFSIFGDYAFEKTLHPIAKIRQEKKKLLLIYDHSQFSWIKKIP